MSDQLQDFRVNVPPEIEHQAERIARVLGLPLKATPAVAQIITISNGIRLFQAIAHGALSESELEPEQRILIDQIRSDSNLSELLEEHNSHKGGALHE